MCTWKWDTWEVCSPRVIACGISLFAAFNALKRTECLHFSLFVSISLSVVSFQFFFFKAFWFSWYSFKEISKFQTQFATLLISKFLPLLLGPHLAGASRQLSFSGCTRHLHVDKMWRARPTGSHTNPVTHCLAKSLVTYVEWKVQLHSIQHENAQWSGTVTHCALDSPACDWWKLPAVRAVGTARGNAHLAS